MTERRCREEKDQALAICTAVYEFPAPVNFLEVECTFHAVTVPNHVHLLHAEKTGGLRDQAIFDFSFQKATLRFRPPTPVEIAMTETGAGALRAVGGWVQVLFLASLAVAARSRREMLAIAGMFLLGQVAAAAIVPRTGWQPAPRFVEGRLSAGARLSGGRGAAAAARRWTLDHRLCAGRVPRFVFRAIPASHRIPAADGAGWRGAHRSCTDCRVCAGFLTYWKGCGGIPAGTSVGIGAAGNGNGVVFLAA